MSNLQYYIYTRISDTKYEQSISNQEAILMNLAGEKFWINKKDIIVLKEQKSGSKKSQRKLFDEMIQELSKDSEKKVEERQYWGIFFFKIDRLARNYNDFVKLERLLDAGYKFISATETIENTYTGRLLFRMLSAFAIYESDKLSNRMSIAKIHSLLEGKLGSIGGKTTIFWYKTTYDRRGKPIDIKIVSKEANIIREIYDMYELWSDKKDIETDITTKIEKKHKGYLKKYIIQNKITTTPLSLIKKIIRNKHAIQYNGIYSVSLKVNDELIQNYFENIMQEERDDMSIEGSTKIGWEIQFKYFSEKLAIVDDSKYNFIHDKFFVEKASPSSNKIKWLFEDILYLNERMKYWVYYKKDKNTYNYIKEVNWKSYTKSENKIRDKINGLFTSLEQKIEWYKDDIKSFLLDSAKNQSLLIKKKLNMQKIVAERMIQYYKNQLEWTKNIKEVKYYMENIRLRKQEEIRIEQKLLQISKDNLMLIDSFIALFTKQNLLKAECESQRDKQRHLYKAMIEKIILDEQWKLTVYLYPYIAEILWKPTENKLWKI